MSTKVKESNDEMLDEYSYKPRNRQKQAEKKKKEKKNNQFNAKLILIPVIVLAVLVVCAYILSKTLPQDVVADNVFVNDIDMSKKQLYQVEEAVRGLIGEDDEFSVISSDKQFEIKASDVGLIVDAKETANKVMAVGKSKNFFKNAYVALKLMISKENVGFVVDYNQDVLDKMLFEFGATINGMSTPPQIEYTADTMTVTPGTPGQNQDTSVARNQFLDAVSKGIWDNIEVTLDYAKPQGLVLDEMYNQLCKPSADAYYDKNENGDVIVVDEVVGVEVDKKALEELINEVNNGNVYTIPAKVTMPEKTKSELEENLFTDVLGSYSSDFSTSSQNRAFNVSRASDSINGYVLMPGETFSYNDVIGNPSLANGYKLATVYANGKTTEGVGGGVCQVSSTLYSAVIYADLDVTERYNHSMTVSYVPLGQDATVSYGVLDFRFKNDTEYPVKIKSVVNGRKLNVSIIGSDGGVNKEVEIINRTVSSTPPTEKITYDASLPFGTRKVTEKGKTGYVVDTYKTVYENGEKVSSEKITRSAYRMTQTEVTLGGTEGQTEEIPTISTEENVTDDNGENIENVENVENNDDIQNITEQTQDIQTNDEPIEF